MASGDDAPVMIRKVVKKGGGGGHHGGAWKVAYADFVTAMMAFFLLMWLLNATTEKQRKGLADYFDPSIPISKVTAGGAGMLQGEDILVPDRKAGTTTKGVRPRPTHREPGDPMLGEPASPDLPAGETPPRGLAPAPVPEPEPAPVPDSAADAYAAAYRAEQARLEAIGVELAAAMAEADDGLTRHFQLRMTPEGLVIEIVDADEKPLFPSGSAAPSPLMGALVEVLVPVLGRVANPLAIVGHTDAAPYGEPEGRSNWELSAERANAARRLMAGAGLPDSRIARVTGRAATAPLVDDPSAPQNRRIAITLLRQVRR